MEEVYELPRNQLLSLVGFWLIDGRLFRSFIYSKNQTVNIDRGTSLRISSEGEQESWA